MMKDRIFLLLAGIAGAGIAWMFWHFLGEAGFNVLGGLSVIVLLLDNLQLRRHLRKLRQEREAE
ncbi:MAG: hypothetical protein LBV44_02220 [Methylobacillus sp.]|jgi:Flp pilus assembly protein TadB|nr:hypothetical protein [Methylobacillus sp.]